ncbi:MAG TPA: PLP-dependent aspartate aminotransferase family protein [Candidatus Saccharimonadales bacterium]|nr:PLP-dependent aspartate aminotransferase family protein [Candidatus Saccharimonadales bacterium]
MGFSTDAIHAGQEPDPVTGAVSVPIYQTSTYQIPALGVYKGFDYARTVNPTRTALETCLARLEGGKRGLAFASGMAAINAVFSMLKAGDHIILSRNVYGGTFRLLKGVLNSFSIETSFVDTTDLANVKAAFTPATRMAFIETPTNPILTLTDIRGCADLCHERKALLVVDNTFMSPYWQRPLALGADMVVHSTTKFINGHSDSVGGAVITATEEAGERLYFIQKSAGAILAPFDCWLVMRGLKTLAVRMERHEENTRKVAEHLEKHPAVRKVHYPGLASHPQHELAKSQARGFGGMVAFDLGSYTAAKALLDSLKLCLLAESLGGVETLISHPASMTHASVPPEERKRIGISDGLVRISVGIEDAEDLIADLDGGLAAAEKAGASTSTEAAPSRSL